jgi:hypothetical protein
LPAAPRTHHPPDEARERDWHSVFGTLCGVGCATVSALGEHFDTVLDSGLFHVFNDAARAEYVLSLKAVTGPGSRYLMPRAWLTIVTRAAG